MKSDIEIAQSATLQPIAEIAAQLGLEEDDLVLHGKYVAKTSLDAMKRLAGEPDGKLILVTAMTPPPKGAGKTTTTIGLSQALAAVGKRAAVAIREPSLGPCMGMKGGAAGGGYSQVLPMEDINLHFTGDLHAVTMAHNLCAAVVDNHLHQQLSPEIHPRKVVWKRVIDMNDRSLRNVIVGLLDSGINGVMREDGFEITAASEIMAILCLATSMRDLKERMGNVIVGYDSLRKPICAREVGVNGAMAALMKNAINPNLVQTTEGVPAFVHGGPFANIAHGCNSVLATKMALKLADYTVTEAGFGADLGAEKFFDIKCRTAGLKPSATVIVVPKTAFDIHGIENVVKHAENMRRYNVPAIISVNRFAMDTDAEMADIVSQCRDAGLEAVVSDYREQGSAGGLELAEKIVAMTDGPPPDLTYAYPDDMPITGKVETICRDIYGAEGVEFSAAAKREIKRIEDLGYGHLPVCMAKTPMSLSDNGKVPGRPTGFSVSVSSARVSAGAGFVVVYTGKVMTMPGLPREPAALKIDVDDNGRISGLF